MLSYLYAIIFLVGNVAAIPISTTFTSIPTSSLTELSFEPAETDANEVMSEWDEYIGKHSGEGYSQGSISRKTPQISLNDMMSMVSVNMSNCPGFNTSFKVPEMRSSDVRWLVEAENRTANDPVLLYSHGGGFCFGMSPGQFQMFDYIYKNLNNPRLSILAFDYTLSNDGKFPQPLIENAMVYNALAESSNNIWLIGDSAGGSLILELERHIQYPFVGVPRVNTNNSPKGLLALSPWVNLHPRFTGTYTQYDGIDSLTSLQLAQMGELYTPDAELLESAELNPYKDTINWSSILPHHSKVFVSYGEYEVLRGDIESWISNADLSNSTVYLEPKGIHDMVTDIPYTSPVTPEIVRFLKKAM